MKRVLLSLFIFLAGCTGSKTSSGPYSIGRDQSWFPLRLEQMSININAFTNALVQELKTSEKKPFQIVDVGWSQLFEGLENREYAGIFTSLSPNEFTTSRYTFSDPFLLLGPVLVVPTHSTARSLHDLEGKIVGVNQYDDSVLIVQRYPSIVIELYREPSVALEELMQGKMNGLLMPTLEARALIDNLYPTQLKIVTPPLDNKGLRLMTLKGEHRKLIDTFNRGLKKLQNKSVYLKLRENFDVE